MPLRRHWLSISGGLGLVALALWLQLTELPPVKQAMERLESVVYDLRLGATLKPRPVDTPIVIVDLDERSLREQGHWPWPRDRVALLVERLAEAGANIIAFDVVFAEPERNSALYVLARMGEIGLDPAGLEQTLTARADAFDNNVRLAEHLRDHEVVLGYLLDWRGDQPVGALPPPVAFADPQAAARVRLPRASTHTGNIPVLQQATPRGGFFTLLPDRDGVVRHAGLLQRYGDDIYPALSLEVVRVFHLAERIDLVTNRVGSYEVVEGIRVGDVVVPTDGKARAVIPFRGPQGTFPYVSAGDVLEGRADPKVFEGAIVLIGTTAQGLYDLRATPVQAVYPGVEVHANLIDGMLSKAIPVEPSWATGANATATLVIGLTLAFALPLLPPITMMVTALLVAGALLGLNFWLWSAHGLVLAIAPLLLLVGLLAVFNIARGFWLEARSRRQLKNMFGQYVPPELVDEMNRNPGGNYGFEGESREMSVLFSDVRGFTTISESLSASGLKSLLNTYFTPMTRIIFQHRGTIDKYVGDMVMAFWGAPLPDERHAEHAIATALEMLAETERLKAQFRAAGLPEVNIGVGVNTGVMNVGDMGSEYRRSYTVLGDAVNLGSRLEGTTKFYGVGLVVGETTRARAGDVFVYRELDLVRVKGKAQAIRVFQPICRSEQASPELLAELERHDEALRRYRHRDWDGARELFAELHRDHPQVHLYPLYLERIEDLRHNDPGEGWDGAYTRTSK